MIADFIFCSGHTNSETKFISKEEYEEFRGRVLSVNYDSRICKILKKHKPKMV